MKFVCIKMNLEGADLEGKVFKRYFFCFSVLPQVVNQKIEERTRSDWFKLKQVHLAAPSFPKYMTSVCLKNKVKANYFLLINVTFNRCNVII